MGQSGFVIAVSHDLLRDLGSNTSASQVRAERCTHRMQINDATISINGLQPSTLEVLLPRKLRDVARSVRILPPFELAALRASLAPGRLSWVRQ